ncbi:hypothetical protein P692DRAFT_20472255 [Suillus brevipes Sb2]|nr:hypothetical protein P692DRAFT_20472255 [Suillus brevipes Sb2]
MTRVSTKSGISISDPRHSFIVPPSFVSSSISSAKSSLHDIITETLVAGLEALCPSRAHGISIIEKPSFLFSLPSMKDILPPSIHRASPLIPQITIIAA